MVKMQLDLGTLYFTFKKRKDGSRRYHYYLYQGGPKLWSGVLEGPLRHVPDDLYTAWLKERETPRVDGLFKQAITDYKASPEFQTLKPPTQRDYLRYLAEIDAKFGKMKTESMNERRARKSFISWRDSMSDRPRRADYAISVLSTVLSWCKDHSLIDYNRADGIGKLHRVNKSEEIWTPDMIEVVCAKAPIEVEYAIRLCADTGLRAKDLIELTWSQVHDDHIRRETSKGSKHGRVVRIPLLPETRELLRSIPKRSTVVLTQHTGLPWRYRWLAELITRARDEAGVESRTLHDLRRTYITRAHRLEDHEIAEVGGWSPETVTQLRRVYVSGRATIKSMARRLEK
ncbi:MAG: tyrosine-type recombinase/integrase [Pseudomonadota bacterium]